MKFAKQFLANNFILLTNQIVKSLLSQNIHILFNLNAICTNNEK